MNTSHKKYKHSILWSTIEACIFHGLLFMHQYTLFTHTTPSLYGVIGTIFGFLYLSVSIINLGLNQALAPFYHLYSQSKHHLFTFIREQLVPNGVLYSGTIIFILGSKHIFFKDINYAHLGIILLCITTESIKKVAKHLLQLSLNFRTAAFFEIGFVISYQALVWLLFLCGFPMSIPLVFGTFFIVSFFHMIGLLFLLHRWYMLLPSSTNQSLSAVVRMNIHKTRFYSYTHSLGKQLFSANVLVPLCAYLYGFEYAALLKLASYATHSITSVIEKILGPSSAVFFAHNKRESLATVHAVFQTASRVASQLMICSLLFIIINFTKLLSFFHIESSLVTISFIYFLIHYLESFFLTLETFFISQERSDILLINTILTTILVINSLLLASTPAYLVLHLLICRAISYAFLLLSARYLWNIDQRLYASPFYVVTSLFISTLVFFLF